MLSRLRFLTLFVCVFTLLLSATSAFALTVIFEPSPVDGRVSPSYSANDIPPRPVNPLGLAPAQRAHGIVNTDNLFLRQGDDVTYATIGILDGGTELFLLGTNGKAGDSLWWYVEVGGLRGWASSQFIILRGNASGLPVVEVLGEPATPVFYIGSENWVYAAPDYAATILCLAPGNRFYEIVGKDFETANFFLVEATCEIGDVTGWIAAPFGIVRNTGQVTIPVLSR